LENISHRKSALSIGLDFSNGGVFSLNKEIYADKELIKSLHTLLKLNLVRLMDVRLHKLEFGPMSLRRASSGEQCMLVIMLGIAGNINDGSLISPKMARGFHESSGESFFQLSWLSIFYSNPFTSNSFKLN